MISLAHELFMSEHYPVTLKPVKTIKLENREEVGDLLRSEIKCL